MGKRIKKTKQMPTDVMWAIVIVVVAILVAGSYLSGYSHGYTAGNRTGYQNGFDSQIPTIDSISSIALSLSNTSLTLLNVAEQVANNNTSLSENNVRLGEEINTLRSLKTLPSNALNPSGVNSFDALSIWSVPQVISNGTYLMGGLLDTFANHVYVQSPVPISFQIFSYGGKRVEAENGTLVDFWFNTTEGCAMYYYEVKSLGDNATNATGFTIYPNITAIYSPTPYLTGVCANYTEYEATK